MEKEYIITNPTKTTIVVTKNSITIIRKGFRNFTSQGLKGDKMIPLKNITSVQLKKPGMFSFGYIQFGLLGGNESKGGSIAAGQDENTVEFSYDTHEDMLELKEYIENYMFSEDKIPLNQTTMDKTPVEKIKEYKELLDLGILSQEEFDEKKDEFLKL